MPLFNNNPQSTTPLTPEVKPPQPTKLVTSSADQVQTNKSSEIPSTPGKVTINSLLSGIKTPVNTSVDEKVRPKDYSQVQEMRFLSVKYKIYTLIIASIAIILYGPLTDAVSASRAKRQEGDKIDTQIIERLESQKEYTSKTELLKKIEANKVGIISCINEKIKCDTLPEDIKKNSEPIKAYIQIGSLKKDKMDVNESKILKSINEFMTKRNILTDDRSYNGTVTNIVIDKTKELENNIIQVPINMTVTFNSKENLISFISNIENNIFYTQTDGLNNSILYRIEELKYDIVNYREAQDVEISLSAYAYND